jgi:N-acetylglucosaminyldiphosphoundecaprenol N-acetyl-beta-D-mannosaminyltransferase
MQKDFPDIEIAGTYSPPYKPEFSTEESQDMVEAVNSAKPDVLWVGMTAPKQEKWIYQNKERLNVSFIGAVGAVFDFYVGSVKRSHPWFLKHGLEWLPRLLQEPRRLWDRTFISAPMFFMRVLMQRISGKH